MDVVTLMVLRSNQASSSCNAGYTRSFGAYNRHVMKALQEEQRKMRERMRTTNPRRVSGDDDSHGAASEPKSLQALLNRIKVLEAENASLKRQLAVLRDQPRQLGQKSSEMSENERRQLFMKYSNVRRY